MKNLIKFVFITLSVVAGLLWTLIEIGDHFFDVFKKHSNSPYVFLGIIIVGVVTIVIKLSRTKFVISGTDSTINFSYGDILSKNGIIVIPVNAEFDTIVGNSVVSEKTLHGKFILKYYKRATSTLESAIQHQLSSISYEDRPQKSKGNRKRYPIGTCVKIEIDKKVFVLVALSRFDDNCIAGSSIEDLNECLSSVWQWIASNLERSDVFLPIMGTGFSRILGNKFEKIKPIIGSGIAAIKQGNIYESFNIVVPVSSILDAANHLEFIEYMSYASKYVAINSNNSGSNGTVVT
jgi:hypothetical protein